MQLDSELSAQVALLSDQLNAEHLLRDQATLLVFVALGVCFLALVLGRADDAPKRPDRWEY